MIPGYMYMIHVRAPCTDHASCTYMTYDYTTCTHAQTLGMILAYHDFLVRGLMH